MTFWNKYKQHVFSTGGVLLILLLLFTDAFSKGMIFGWDIFLTFFYNRAYGFGNLLKGEIPLWNPYQFCGFPFTASLQSALFYPLNWVFLVFSAKAAFTLSAFIHTGLSWLGMYLFVYSITRRALPAFLAGLVYMLGGFPASHVYAGHITITCAYSWLPFIMLALDKSLRQRAWRWAVAGGVLLALQLLAGYPALTYYSIFGAGIYCLGWFWVYWRKKPMLKSAILAIMPGAILVISGLLLAAIQMVPTYSYSLISARAGGAEYEIATSFSMPPENFITYLVPFFFGDSVARPYWGRWYLWEVLPYAGILPLCLLVIGFFSKNPRCRAMSWLALLCALMAFGGYAGYYIYIYKFLPGISMFRGPGRVLYLYTFALAAGVGFVLAHYWENRDPYRDLFNRAWKITAGLAGGILVILVLSYESSGGESIFWKTVIEKSVSLGERFLEIRTGSKEFLQDSYKNAQKSLEIAFVWLAMSAGLLKLASLNRKRVNQIIPFLTAALLIMDLLWASGRYFKGTDRNPITLEKEIVDELRENESIIPPRIASARDVEDLSAGSLAGIAHVGGYDPALVRRYTEYVNILGNRKPDEELVISNPIRPGKLLKLMGVSHVIASPEKRPYPGSNLVLSTTGGKVYKLRDPFPRALLMHNVEIIPEKQRRLERLKELDPQKTAIAESPLPLQLEKLPDGAEENVTFTKYEVHHVALSVEAASNALLVFSDAWYPAWEARIDGRPTQVFPVNHLFRGVCVPTGKHEIEFCYSNRLFRVGCSVSLATLCSISLLLISGLFMKRRKRKSAE